jgi:hypothetical protein
MSNAKIAAKTVKEVAKSLSATLKENPVTVEIDGEEVELTNIKVVGVKRATVMAMIQESVLALVEAEVELDNIVVDFFNNYIAEDEEEETETDDETEEDSEKKTSGKKKTSDKKKADGKKTTTKVERDSHGFSVNSKYHTFAEMISEQPMKMSEVRKELNDNYYNIVKAKPEIFAKNDLGYFYVIGSKAEKMAKSMKAPAKKNADKKKTTGKTTGKKTTGKTAGKTAGKTTGKKTTSKKTTVTKKRSAKK